MRRVSRVLAKNQWPADATVASVTLTFDARHKRRIRMTDDNGGDFLLDLPEATVLGDGDGFELQDSNVIEVHAAAEPVAEVKARSAVHLARLAWHVGNRHEPVQVVDDTCLRVRNDHVLINMLEGLGAEIVRTTAPFSPESGAYSHGGHGHDR